MKTLSLFVFIDAFGWELARGRSFLEPEARVKKPLETVFGYSCTCDPTIITGVPPREHGHFSFFVYDREKSPFRALRALGVLPRSLVDRGRVRNKISQFVQKAYGYTGYFQLYAVPFKFMHLFDYTEKRDIYLEGGINGGQPSIFVLLDRAGVPYFRSDWRKGETEAVADLKAALADGAPRMAYLYLAKMDALLHALGTGAPEIDAKIEGYQATLRAVVEDARKSYDEVRLFVFSDHGMTNITRTSPLMAAIDASGLVFGEDYAAVYDSTMARFWFIKEGARERIMKVLEGHPDGRILDDATLRDWGVDFADRRYGELFFLLHPGVLLCPSFMGTKPLAGMHGYAPDSPGSRASFFSTADLDHPPEGLADLFALMRRESGLDD
ncbi:MAG: alkaline phosphatase family protein [Spirochaetota bacterium]